MTPPAKVAFSHDWLNGMRGGEKCLEAVCELFPSSPIYTLFHEKGKVSPAIEKHPIKVSSLQKYPGIFSHYRYYLPFFSKAIEEFRPEGCDLVISMSHCVAKGIQKPAGAVHVCYCFTPVRYAWELFHEYFGRNIVLAPVIRFFTERLKAWDFRVNSRVDHFVAISEHVKKRIEKFYGRPARVIYPPADTQFFMPDASVKREEFYLVVSALVPYKRIDVAVEAFNKLGRKLVIIGDGPEKARLQKMAGPTIEFLGWQPDAVLRDYYRRMCALVFPGEEDFGIVPVEAQACGGFVIAYKKGGALETVLDGKTGVFFDAPSAANLEEAVRRFEMLRTDASEPAKNAARFSRERFQYEMKRCLEEILENRR